MILKSVLGMALLFFLLTIGKDPQYEAEGSFKEQASATSMNSLTSQMGSIPFAATQMGANSSLDSTLTLMKSHKVLSKVVRLYGLQVTIEEQKNESTWKNCFNNIKTFKSILMANALKSSKEMILDDDRPILAFKNVYFPSRLEQDFFVRFISNTHFVIENDDQNSIYELGKEAIYKTVSFHPFALKDQSLKGRCFKIELKPEDEVTLKLSKDLIIEKDTKAKNLLHLRYRHKDPFLAQNIVNATMSSYKQYLDEDQEHKIEEQLAYLNQRQNVVLSHLDEHIEASCNYSKEHMQNFEGFLQVDKELEYAIKQQADLKQKTSTIDLETLMLQSHHGDDFFYYFKDDAYSLSLFEKRRALQQKKNNLLFSLSQDSTLYNYPPFKENSTLSTLESAAELFEKLQLKQNDVSLNLSNYQLAREFLEKPSDELSSIQLLLPSDQVTGSMMSSVMQIQKKLHEQKGDQTKEYTRLKLELITLKDLLKTHIDDVVAALELERSWNTSSMYHLQKQMIQLIDRDIKGIDRQLEAFKEAKLRQLRDEKNLISKQFEHLNRSLELLPQKRLNELKLSAIYEQHLRILEELAKISESRNVNSNMVRSESQALDLAYLPIYPVLPLFVIFTFLGGFLGFLGSMGVVLYQIIFKPVGATCDLISSMGIKVLGSLSKNRESTRVIEVATRFIQEPSKGIVVVSSPYSSSSISAAIAKLASLTKSVLLIDMSFLSKEEINEKNPVNLKNWLEEKIEGVKPVKLAHHLDYLYGGTYEDKWQALLLSQKFLSLLQSYKENYSLVILHFPLQITELDYILWHMNADKIVIELKEEPIKDLESLYVFSEACASKVGLILLSDCT